VTGLTSKPLLPDSGPATGDTAAAVAAETLPLLPFSLLGESASPLLPAGTPRIPFCSMGRVMPEWVSEPEGQTREEGQGQTVSKDAFLNGYWQKSHTERYNQNRNTMDNSSKRKSLAKKLDCIFLFHDVPSSIGGMGGLGGTTADSA
jgi:Fe-S cluster biosynthesis and repair protein YggX